MLTSSPPIASWARWWNSEIAAAGDRDLARSDLSQEYQQGARREGIVGTLTGILLVVAVYLMVTKPGL